MKGSPRRTSKATAEALARKRKEDSYLLKNWRNWNSERVGAALAGPDKVIVRRLLDTCKAAVLWTDLDPGALLAPFADTDPDTAFVARRIVSSYWGAMREAAGLPPFDDMPLPF